MCIKLDNYQGSLHDGGQQNVKFCVFLVFSKICYGPERGGGRAAVRFVFLYINCSVLLPVTIFFYKTSFDSPLIKSEHTRRCQHFRPNQKSWDHLCRTPFPCQSPLKICLAISLPKFNSKPICLIVSRQFEQKHFSTLFQQFRGICVLPDEQILLSIFNVLSTVFELLVQITNVCFFYKRFKENCLFVRELSPNFVQNLMSVLC